MSVFSSLDYKTIVREFIQKQPKKGRGMSRRIAHHLRIHPAMVSQIFSGDRDLTPEQAIELASFMGLAELESDYFLLLVQFSRAGTHRLKENLRKQIKALQENAQDLRNRLPKDVELTEEDKAQFYSAWHFSGVRLASSLQRLTNPQEIADQLGISVSLAARTLEFLLTTGLCLRVEDGGLELGPSRTHLESSSPLIQHHHRNWRLKAFQGMESEDNRNLFYSGPMSMSHEAYDTVRELLVELLSQVRNQAEKSQAETLACLNLDLFRFGKS
ncbi:MAG: TIGR02147 family protein [Bdellovibrionaceae bacterium]|nr:TIGR02147 family protein [Pseudobdellovibrionaceae bacterium]